MGKIQKNSIILLAKEAVLNISAVFVVGYLAKKLGAEDYGKFTYSISFATLFSIISNLGIRQYATREIIRFKDKAKIIHGKVIFARFILSIIMVVTGIVAGLFLEHDQIVLNLIIIALTSKFFFASATNNFIIFEAHEDMQYNAITQTTSRIIVIVLTLAALFAGLGIYIIALIYLFGDVVQYGISWLLVKKKYFNPKMQISKSDGIDLVKSSVPFALFSIFYLIYFEISKIMLFHLSGDKDVGIYQAASILAYKFLIISDAVGTAIFPKIIEFGKFNHSEYRKLSLKAMSFMFGIGLFSAIGMFLFSDLIINSIYRSKEYIESIVVLRYIVWLLPLLFLSKILSFMLISRDKQNLLARIYFAMVIALVLSNAALIPAYKSVGAVWAMYISESVGALAFLFYYKEMGLKKLT